jgi:hypothetical protein
MKNTTADEVAVMLLDGMPDDMTLGDFRSYVTNWVNNKNIQEKNREESRVRWYQEAMDKEKCFKIVNNPMSMTYIHCFNNPEDDPYKGYSSEIHVHGEIIVVSVDETQISVMRKTDRVNKYWLNNPYETTFLSGNETENVTEITLEEFNNCSSTITDTVKKLQSCL